MIFSYFFLFVFCNFCFAMEPAPVQDISLVSAQGHSVVAQAFAPHVQNALALEKASRDYSLLQEAIQHDNQESLPKVTALVRQCKVLDKGNAGRIERYRQVAASICTARDADMGAFEKQALETIENNRQKDAENLDAVEKKVCEMQKSQEELFHRLRVEQEKLFLFLQVKNKMIDKIFQRSKKERDQANRDFNAQMAEIGEDLLNEQHKRVSEIERLCSELTQETKERIAGDAYVRSRYYAAVERLTPTPFEQFCRVIGAGLAVGASLTSGGVSFSFAVSLLGAGYGVESAVRAANRPYGIQKTFSYDLRYLAHVSPLLKDIPPLSFGEKVSNGERSFLVGYHPTSDASIRISMDTQGVIGCSIEMAENSLSHMKISANRDGISATLAHEALLFDVRQSREGLFLGATAQIPSESSGDLEGRRGLLVGAGIGSGQPLYPIVLQLDGSAERA